MRYDLSVPLDLTMALGPDLFLMVGAMAVMLFAAWRPDSVQHQRAVGAASLWVTAITMALVLFYQWRGATSGAGIIAVDNFRWAADLILLVGTACTIALAMDYNVREGITAGETHVLVLFATSGMMLLAAARDLMIVFLGIELMSVAVYVLAGLNRRSPRAAEGALKYFLLGAFSTGFLLYGIALIYGATGSTNFAVIGERLASVDSSGVGVLRSPMLLAGVALLLVGFGFKVAAAPFHMWAPDVYEGAPTPITAYMAAAVKAAAFASFLRVWIEALPSASPSWHTSMWYLAVATMIVGNVVALAQKNIKRILAYSSIAHAGYVMVALTVVHDGNNTGSASAFLFYLFAYTLATMGAFGVVIALGRAGEADLGVEGYAGLWHERPWLAGAMAVFMLALLGFPIFGGIGFFAKFYMLRAAIDAPRPQTWLAVWLVLTSVISAGYYLNVIKTMFMEPRLAGAPAIAPSAPLTRMVIGATVILILVFGLFPSPVADWAGRGGSMSGIASPLPPPAGAPGALIIR